MIFTSRSSTIPNFSFTELMISSEKSYISCPVAFPVALMMTNACCLCVATFPICLPFQPVFSISHAAEIFMPSGAVYPWISG